MPDHDHPTDAFDDRVRRALDDATLGAALQTATERFYLGRRATWQELGDPDAVRRQVRAAREKALSHLDETLTTLAANIEARGGHVHFAVSADEARHIVLDICRQANARTVAKSKSMLTEELDLNHALEAAGVRVVETDRGEWIIQLAGEPPSHIIAPAIHKTKAQVAALFSQALGQPIPADASIPELTRIAREQLRQVFLEADVGISGVNFAIAETGTVSLVTNEGNGRYVTGVPPIHIAMMGAEKVVGTWEEWATSLKLLTRSATGQRISSYVSTVTGPRRPGDADGPDEFHLVIVDAGRTKILGSAFRESLLCIRCGACLNACPVYREIGGHAYGSAYSGPIGAVITPLLFGLDRFPELPHASSLCGACLDACPMMIDLPRMLIDLRRLEAEGDPQFNFNADTRGGPPPVSQPPTPQPPLRSWAERLSFRLYRLGAQSPALYRLAGLGRLALKPFARGERVAEAPLPILGNWTAHRDFPLPAARPFHARWSDLAAETTPPQEARHEP